MEERENALYWWSKKDLLFSITGSVTKREITDKYFGKNRIISSLTGREIQEIWQKEGCPNKLYNS